MAKYSISRKISLVAMLVSSIAVLSASLIGVKHQYETAHTQAVKQIQVLAAATAFNVASPTMFNDEQAAKDVLQALSVDPQVVSATLMTSSGVKLAQFVSNTTTESQHLTELNMPVSWQHEALGTLNLRVDFSGLDQQLYRQIFYTCLTATLALLFTGLLANYLIGIITKPLRGLSEIVEQISAHGNYTLRAPNFPHQDEVGKLSQRFNAMLNRIENQNTELKIQQDFLEQRVNERTAQLQAVSQQAQAANQAKSDFLAVMSHEIRTPLNGILGMLSLLHHDKLSDQQQRYTQVAKSSSEDLLCIINDILDFSKIEAGKFELESTPFHLNNVLENLIERYTPIAQAKHIQLHCSLPTNNLFVCADAARLTQVLTNLLSNALKFTEQGEVILRVELQSETESSATLAFSVSDTGIGITEEQRKKLFSAFTQADLSMSRKYGGTGLGLVISQRLVSLMQSEIHLKSQHNEGSNFHFTLQLPKKVGELSIVNKQENTATADLSAPLSVLNGYVLLVEDNLVNQEVALAMLHKIGIQAEVACNGEIALAMLKQNRFDVILMDCQMPIMDGFETTAHIRAKEITQSSKPTPIIALTANAIMGDKESCLAKGMDDYLSKPFTLAQLHDTLRPWLPTEKISSSAPLETLANSATTTHVFAHIDKKVIAQLEHLGNNVLSRVITFFAQTGPEILYEIETAIANSSCEQVYKSAHNLKNSAANLGATELAACCKELESQGRANLLQNADLLLNKARHLYELSLAELIDIQHGTHHG